MARLFLMERIVLDVSRRKENREDYARELAAYGKSRGEESQFRQIGVWLSDAEAIYRVLLPILMGNSKRSRLDARSMRVLSQKTARGFSPRALLCLGPRSPAQARIQRAEQSHVLEDQEHRRAGYYCDRGGEVHREQIEDRAVAGDEPDDGGNDQQGPHEVACFHRITRRREPRRERTAGP